MINAFTRKRNALLADALAEVDSLHAVANASEEIIADLQAQMMEEAADYKATIENMRNDYMALNKTLSERSQREDSQESSDSRDHTAAGDVLRRFLRNNTGTAPSLSPIGLAITIMSHCYYTKRIYAATTLHSEVTGLDAKTSHAYCNSALSTDTGRPDALCQLP